MPSSNISALSLLRRALLATTLCVSSLGAQGPGSLAHDRLRLAEITGDTAQPMSLTDVTVRRLPGIRSGGARQDVVVTLVRPELRSTWNSALPYSLNDGALWAGRGYNQSLSAGLELRAPARSVTLHVRIAPTLVYSQNRPFQIIPGTDPARSAYANPLHADTSGAPLDLPMRFGDRHVLGIDGGRSRIALEWPKVTAGITTEGEWWGPGIRNALIMSDNAPGIPRWFVEPASPIRTRIGRLHARLISGTLTQSLFFGNSDSENRTLSGIRIELVPAFDSTLTLGFARVVYAPIGPEASPFTSTLARSLDALVRWENLSGVGQQRSDQIGSLFARWIFPEAGFEVYGEWSRMDLPRTATELLTAAHHTGGWTLGLQWAQPRRDRSYLRLQSELTYLEQSRVFPDRPTPDFYSGMASPQGYTQRGQVIGASIGPGASSQWIAIDWLAPIWQAGLFLGRVRWENDAMYRRVATFWDHDVSLLGGVRGGWRMALSDISAEVTFAKRFNYLFQNGIARPGVRTEDVNNLTLALSVTPR